MVDTDRSVCNWLLTQLNHLFATGGQGHQVRRVQVRQGRGPGHDRGPAVLHRLRRAAESGAAAGASALVLCARFLFEWRVGQDD